MSATDEKMKVESVMTEEMSFQSTVPLIPIRVPLVAGISSTVPAPPKEPVFIDKIDYAAMILNEQSCGEVLDPLVSLMEIGLLDLKQSPCFLEYVNSIVPVIKSMESHLENLRKWMKSASPFSELGGPHAHRVFDVANHTTTAEVNSLIDAASKHIGPLAFWLGTIAGMQHDVFGYYGVKLGYKCSQPVATGKWKEAFQAAMEGSMGIQHMHLTAKVQQQPDQDSFVEEDTSELPQ